MSGGYDEALYLMYLGQVPMFRRCSKDELDRVAALGRPTLARSS